MTGLLDLQVLPLFLGSSALDVSHGSSLLAFVSMCEGKSLAYTQAVHFVSETSLILLRETILGRAVGSAWVS